MHRFVYFFNILIKFPTEFPFELVISGLNDFKKKLNFNQFCFLGINELLAYTSIELIVYLVLACVGQNQFKSYKFDVIFSEWFMKAFY